MGIDVHRRVTPGTPLEIGAGQFNYLIEGAEIAHRLKRLNTQTIDHALVPSIIVLQNSTGQHLPRFAVVCCGAAGADPQYDNVDEFCRAVWVQGDTPQPAAEQGRIAILQEPLPIGEIGRAAIAGATPVRLLLPYGRTVGSPLETRAAVISGDCTKLAAGSGGIPVLWHEDKGASVEVWAYISLPALGGPYACLYDGSGVVAMPGTGVQEAHVYGTAFSEGPKSGELSYQTESGPPTRTGIQFGSTNGTAGTAMLVGDGPPDWLPGYYVVRFSAAPPFSTGDRVSIEGAGAQGFNLSVTGVTQVEVPIAWDPETQEPIEWQTYWDMTVDGNWNGSQSVLVYPCGSAGNWDLSFSLTCGDSSMGVGSWGSESYAVLDCQGSAAFYVRRRGVGFLEPVKLTESMGVHSHAPEDAVKIGNGLECEDNGTSKTLRFAAGTSYSSGQEVTLMAEKHDRPGTCSKRLGLEMFWGDILYLGIHAWKSTFYYNGACLTAERL